MPRVGPISASLLCAFAVAGLSAAPVLAHEERDVAGHSLTVGLIGEPVFVGEESGLELFVSRGGQPVEGLERTLRAEVVHGDQRRALELRPRFGSPGAYESVFIPTAAGAYTFRISGTIGAASVDETFTSSPQGFDEVREVAAGQFPFQLPAFDEVAAAARQGAQAADQLPLALALGGAGLVAGVAALGLALAGRRRPRA